MLTDRQYVKLHLTVGLLSVLGGKGLAFYERDREELMAYINLALQDLVPFVLEDSSQTQDT